ncbi:MAG: hypothetical protein HUU29_10275 [Planctomycetaceae bacterium]|nr:hypothetical protein [Planctomycetaceae bacterium]
MDDVDLSELHAPKEPKQDGPVSTRTKVVRAGTDKHPKRRTLADTIKNLLMSGEFIVADDPNYTRRMVSRLCYLLALLAGAAFITVFIIKLVDAHV